MRFGLPAWGAGGDKRGAGAGGGGGRGLRPKSTMDMAQRQQRLQQMMTGNSDYQMFLLETQAKARHKRSAIIITVGVIACVGEWEGRGRRWCSVWCALPATVWRLRLRNRGTLPAHRCLCCACVVGARGSCKVVLH